MEDYNLTDFPYEILSHIFSYSASKSVYNLSLTCRLFADVIKHNIPHIFGLINNLKTFKNLSNFIPHPEQVKMLYYLKKSNKEWNFIQSPMGSGKTAIMLTLALQTKSIILINTRIYTSWIKELKNFGLKTSQKSIEESDVLLVHTKFPNHRGHFLRNGASFRPNLDHLDDIKQKIVITTRHYLRSYPNYFKKWIGSEENKIIMDEAHLVKGRDFKIFSMARNIYTRVFFFSATNLDFIKSSKETTFRGRIEVIAKEDYPKIRYSRKQLTLTDDSLSELLNSKNLQPYKHIVIFSVSKLQNLRTWIKSIEKKTGRSVIVFSNTAPTTLTRWEKKENAVLMCSYSTASEGTNFSHTDCAIFFDFGKISLDKARQSMGRIRRKNNVHRKIRVYFCEERETRGDIYNIKGRMNSYYALNLDLPHFYKKSEDSIRRIYNQLSKDGYDPKKLTHEEIRLIFGCGMQSNYIEFKEIKTIPFDKLLGYVIMN
jgi:superfamily II DNA or RNA helicase